MTENPNFSKASSNQITSSMGHTLARIRIAQNITQSALAERAGIAEKTLRNFEKGQGASLDTFIRLMQALGLGPHLENLLPDPGIQPIDEVKRKGRERQRARRSTPTKASGSWTWNDGETP